MARLALLCLFGLMAPAAEAFAFTRSSQRAMWNKAQSPYSSTSDCSRLLYSSNDGDATNDDFLSNSSGNNTTPDPFMTALKARMEQVEDRETKLPIIVLDTMLPRQTIKMEMNDPIFKSLIQTVFQQENPSFGVIGMARLRVPPNNDIQMVPLQNGVLVQVVGQPTRVIDDEGGKDPNDPKNEYLRVELKAVKRFRIVGQVSNDEGGWSQGRVRFEDSREEEAAEVVDGLEPLSLARARQVAAEFAQPVDRWIALARACERTPGQIDDLLDDIGPMPPADQPSERAFWVGALINPLPGMGVAMEIRPMLLMSRTAEERTRIAMDGLQASIKHMEGSERLF